jgi:hypothetical protein
MQTGSSRTLIGWKSGSNHIFVPRSQGPNGGGSVAMDSACKAGPRVQYPPGSAPPERYFFPTEYKNNEENGGSPQLNGDG